MNKTQDILKEIKATLGEDMIVYRMEITEEMKARMAQIIAEQEEESNN